ncbi:MAG TPA: heavy-metal-associated domain-containing protein [Gemmatimonadaceae bacterium]|nr:heavy-metal-associated domain-containing protein [Gemmatimonadaceae bacterium]
MRMVDLRISGMHCGHCVEAVRAALAAVPGATVEHVEIGNARVRLDEEKSGVGALVDAVYEAGYEAEEVVG